MSSCVIANALCSTVNANRLWDKDRGRGFPVVENWLQVQVVIEQVGREVKSGCITLHQFSRPTLTKCHKPGG